MTLSDLKKNQSARVIGFAASENTTPLSGPLSDPLSGALSGPEFDSDHEHDLETRLREIGFAEGDVVEALHFGLFGANPMSVRLNGALIALRREDAKAILIELTHAK